MMLAAAASAILGEPSDRPQPEPDGREEAVEHDKRQGEERVPGAPAPERDLRPRFHVARVPSPRRWTARRIRWAVSSIESSETSITPHPTRRSIPAAYSTS